MDEIFDSEPFCGSVDALGTKRLQETDLEEPWRSALERHYHGYDRCVALARPWWNLPGAVAGEDVVPTDED